MKTVVLLFVFGVVQSGKLPDGLILCHKSDPKFEACLMTALEDGYKRFNGGFKPLGIPPVDPIMVPEMSHESSDGLSQKYKNVKMTGVSQFKVTSVKFDLDNLILTVRANLPHMESQGDYELKGKFVSFDLNAKGKYKLVLDNSKVVHELKMERFERDGAKYLRVVDWKIAVDPERVTYDYENLIPGNEQLSKTVLDTINENGREVFLDQGRPVLEAFAQIHKLIGNKVFEHVPEDEIFLP